MCGLTGILRTEKDPNSIEELVMATSALRHRGPDDEGYMIVDSETHSSHYLIGNDSIKNGQSKHIADFKKNMVLGFGFRRLSIQDLSSNGHQPMTADWTKSTIMLNGEIYNFIELRDELIKAGYHFKSSGDTEVVLAAYENWGLDCFSRFEGMWAIIIFDPERNKLILSRDHFGIKPLYYHFSATSFKFASEIKSLMQFKDFEQVANKKSVFHYIRSGRPGLDNQSIFKDVLQVPPGHSVCLNLNSLHSEIAKKSPKMHQVALQTFDAKPTNEALIIENLQSLLNDSLSKHIRSDVPLAFNLSGGIDSSGLVAMASKLTGKPENINAFSYIANENFLSEEKWVDIVANHIGISVNKLQPNSNDLVNDIEKMMVMQDEPIGSLSPYAQFKVFEQINLSGFKVSIDGQGADEIFGGYLHYLLQAMLDHIRAGQLDHAHTLLKFGGDLFPGGRQKLIQQTKNFVSNLHRNPKKRTVDKLLPVHFTNDYFSELDDEVDIFQTKEFSLRGALDQQLNRTSIPELLRLADRNSMGFSVESRVPYLDVNIVKFAKALPNLMLISAKGETKTALRSCLSHLLPSQIIKRRDKIGFTVPEKQWLFTIDEWVNDQLLSGNGTNIIKSPLVAERWQAIKEGKVAYNQSLWRAINLIYWSNSSGARFI